MSASFGLLLIALLQGASICPQPGQIHKTQAHPESLLYRDGYLDQGRRHGLPVAMNLSKTEIQGALRRLDGLLKQNGFQGWPCDPNRRPQGWCPSARFTFGDPVLDRFWTSQKVAWHYEPSTRCFDVLVQTPGDPSQSLTDLVLITDALRNSKVKPLGYIGVHMGADVSTGRFLPGFPPWVKTGRFWIVRPEYNEQFYRPDYVIHPELGVAEVFNGIETHRSHERLLQADAAEMTAHLSRGGHPDDDVATHGCAEIFREDLPVERTRACGFEWMRVKGRNIALRMPRQRAVMNASKPKGLGMTP